MFKKVLLCLMAVLMVFTSCQNETVDPNATGSLRVIIPQSRTILPNPVTIASYEVTLSSTNSELTYTESFTSSIIEFSDIRVGSYSVIVNGKDSNGNVVMTNSSQASVTITANAQATCAVTITYIASGKGSLSVDISWVENDITTGPFREALDKKSLGFQAYKADGTVYGTDAIQWVEDFTSASFTYTDTNLEATKGTEIAFRIFTNEGDKTIAIAETFPTVVQIYQNVTSTPDQNESNNFSINKNNTITYLRNVSNAAATIDSDNPETKLNVTWTNRDYSNGVYPVTVDVTIKDNNSTSTTTNSVVVESKDGANSTTFEGLTKTTSYSISFKVKGSIGYSTTYTPITNARTKTPVTSIEFPENFADQYVAGDSITVGAVIKPTEATYQDYTVSVNGIGADVEGKTLNIKSFGDYTITITATDNETATATKDIVAVLQSPASFSSSETENGLNLYWSTVSGATGYVIEKTTLSGTDATETITVGNLTEYLDSNLYTGSSYHYTIKAITSEGEKYASAVCKETVTYTTDPAKFTVEIKDIDRPTFAISLPENLGHIIENSTATSFTVATPSVEKATKYKWVLNGTTIKEGSFSAATESIKIDGTTEGLNWDGDENTNSLVLVITIGESEYSTTAYFSGISEDPGRPILSYVNEDNILYYNSTDNRSAKITVTGFTNSPEYTPSVTWTSSDPETISVDDKGNVTALKNGSATITATVASTGERASITLTVNVKMGEISFKTLPTSYLVKEKTGVTVEDTYKSVNLRNYITLTGQGGLTPSTNDVETWTSSNTDVLTVDNGVVTPVGAGTATISATTDGVTGTTVEITVLDIDITVDGSVLTGGSKKISGLAWDGPYALSLKFANDYYTSNTWTSSPFKNTWCLDGNTSKFSGTLSFDVESNDYTGSVDRGSDAAQYTVTAVIELRSSEKTERVATLSFTATS